MTVKIKTAEQIIPMCYAYSTPEIKRHDGWAYSTPEIKRHDGWVKIGYTDKQDVSTRIKQQTHTSDTLAVEEWRGMAVFDDGSGEIFHDTDFHRYLEKQKIERIPETEWFHLDGDQSLLQFSKFRRNHGILKTEGVIPYTLRAEQKRAGMVSFRW